MNGCIRGSHSHYEDLVYVKLTGILNGSLSFAVFTSLFFDVDGQHCRFRDFFCAATAAMAIFAAYTRIQDIDARDCALYGNGISLIFTSSVSFIKHLSSSTMCNTYSIRSMAYASFLTTTIQLLPMITIAFGYKNNQLGFDSKYGTDESQNNQSMLQDYDLRHGLWHSFSGIFLLTNFERMIDAGIWDNMRKKSPHWPDASFWIDKWSNIIRITILGLILLFTPFRTISYVMSTGVILATSFCLIIVPLCFHFHVVSNLSKTVRESARHWFSQDNSCNRRNRKGKHNDAELEV